MKKTIITLALLCAFTIVQAQSVHPWQELFDEMTTLDDIGQEGWEETFDVLCQLEQHPLNINTATREQLEQIPFLSAQQTEDIQAYIYQYGAMKSLGELAMIPSIDYQTRRLLNYFVFAAEPEKKETLSWSDVWKYGKHEILLSTQVPFYERKGDQDGYLGGRVAHSLRYRFSRGDRMSVGLVADQDAGEPFFTKDNPWGYDFYSFYINLKRLGRLRQLTVGRYRIAAGMGLVINNDFGFSKLSALSTLGTPADHIRPHASRSDRDYLQGAAATVAVSRRMEVSAFLSYRGIDATLTDGGQAISTILRTGYHRTTTETAKKNNCHELLAGGMVRYRSGAFHVGAVAAYDAFSLPLRSNTDLAYQRHNPEGKTFFHAGVNYGYTAHRLTVSGETAINDKGRIATLNTVSYRPSWALTLMALQRYYAPGYRSMHANSYSEGSNVQNEVGIMAGVKWIPNAHFTLTAYTDYAHFPEPRYLATREASNAWDNLIQGAYHGEHFTATARYRLHYRQRDYTVYNDIRKENEVKGLDAQTEHRVRLTAGYNDNRWKCLTQADMTYSQWQQNSFGWMVSQTLSAALGTRFRIDASAGYFHTDDYDSRIYAYDTGTLYQFSFPTYDGEGIRYSLLVRADINSHLLLIARVQSVNYFDRSAIGSGLQMIDRSSKTDLQLQLRIRL